MSDSATCPTSCAPSIVPLRCRREAFARRRRETAGSSRTSSPQPRLASADPKGSVRGAADQGGPAVEDRQDLVALLREQHDDNASHTHVAIAGKLALILGRVEQGGRQGA